MSDTTQTGAANPEGTQPGSAPNAGTGKTYSQADLDRIVGERLSRERSKLTKDTEEREGAAVARFREEHGLDDDALAEWAQRDKAAAAARQTKAEATKAKNESEKLQSKLKAAHAKLDQLLRKDAIVSAAVAAGCTDPSAAVAFLSDRVRLDLETFAVGVVNEKGEPSGTVEDAVNSLMQEKRYLLPPQGNFAGSGARGGEPSQGNNGRSPDFATDRGARLAGLREIFSGR